MQIELRQPRFAERQTSVKATLLLSIGLLYRKRNPASPEISQHQRVIRYNHVASSRCFFIAPSLRSLLAQKHGVHNTVTAGRATPCLRQNQVPEENTHSKVAEASMSLQTPIMATLLRPQLSKSKFANRMSLDTDEQKPIKNRTRMYAAKKL